MRITFLLKGTKEVGSSRIRAIQFFPLFESEGIEVKCYSRNSLSNFFSNFFYWLKFLFSCFRSDLTFIQKPILPFWIFNLLIFFKCKYIVDFDDAIWIDAKHKNHFNSLYSSYGLRLKKIIKKASLVIVGSEYLKDEIYENDLNSNVKVLRPSIQINLSKHIFEKKKVNIGWIGHSTNLHEIQDISNCLKRIVQKGSVELVICTDKIPEDLNKWVKFIPWSEKNETLFFETCGIGLMPLKDNLRTRGRCGYKCIQYMANMIPVVASDVGVAKELIDHDASGVLIRNNHEWEREIERLINDPKKRQYIAQNAFDFIRLNCDREINAIELLRLFYSVDI
ncbi:glycosyltransferase [Algoriphagus sp. oki45]|uniref:glycosyltransferase n=1 Tax=Algoriphagus sp. oki45 TaxID=3067294 RepID=UPI0027EC7538|nr:glycosyltransferase [Algoriphagus sp. oki45]